MPGNGSSTIFAHKAVKKDFHYLRNRVSTLSLPLGMTEECESVRFRIRGKRMTIVVSMDVQEYESVRVEIKGKTNDNCCFNA